MIILDEQKLSNFFNDVSSGFEHTFLDILIVIAIILVFTGFLLLMYRLQKKRISKDRAERSREKYEHALKKFDLNPSDQDIIERLIRYLNTPDKKHLLLLNQSTFNACAARLRGNEDIPEAALSALRIKLGFSAQDPEKIPCSSAELPAGMTVLIVAKEKRIHGNIASCQSQSIIISPLDDSVIPSASPVTVYFQNRAGIFSFTSFVQSCLEDETTGEKRLHIAHSEDIKRIQRRKYYRKKIYLPVFVRPAGSENKPVLSAFLDLGGGGASLKNPEGSFKPGDDLELTFHPRGAVRLNVIAEVKRVSGKGQILHVIFEHLREAARDRIIGSLFRFPGSRVK